ncbi:MAG: hypothetical protein RXR41_04720, partial [Candidatus Marsarchaeota archaeon]
MPVERRRDARGRERLCGDGILAKYSRRKRIDEPGSPVRKGGVVHWSKTFKTAFFSIEGMLLKIWPRSLSLESGSEGKP